MSGDRGIAVAAVDLGASGGRIAYARVGPDSLSVRVLGRFPTRTVPHGGHTCWDLEDLWTHVLSGLRAAAGAAAFDGVPLVSVGVDSWGVDYGLLDGGGRLLGPPVHYRDPRTGMGRARVAQVLDDESLYRATGTQLLPIDTLFQLASEGRETLAGATLLLIPDLLTHWLCGAVGAERTNASTTALAEPGAARWSPMVSDALDLPRSLLPPLVDPGTDRGVLLPAVRDHLAGGDPARRRAVSGTRVVAVASHDTASAVVAVPATDSAFAYISCGTWSLVGVERHAPVVTDDGRVAGLTNEVGVEGTIRYLRNVSGLFPLQECLRVWGVGPAALPGLLDAAAEVADPYPVPDVDTGPFATGGDMPARVAQACREVGARVPTDRAGTVRVLLAGLARAHARALADVRRCSGQRVDAVHLVGGGARHPLLADLTARSCGVPVHRGPVEATLLGNVAVQAQAGGLLPDRWAARALVAAGAAAVVDDAADDAADDSGEAQPDQADAAQGHRAD